MRIIPPAFVRASAAQARQQPAERALEIVRRRHLGVRRKVVDETWQDRDQNGSRVAVGHACPLGELAQHVAAENLRQLVG
jgi:hypothetical protein